MGLRVPLLGLKGYSLTVDCARGVAPSLSITDSRHRIVFARLGNRLRVCQMTRPGGFFPPPQTALRMPSPPKVSR
jgi:D-amino-acid dehydrogenase